MRPFRKYPNGGDIRYDGVLPEVNLTASRANWQKQKELRKELEKAQQDYNNLIGDYGLTADDQAQLGFQDYQGGMSSVEELQAKINKLNESYKNTQDQFASANRALADLRTAYPDEWNNKTVSDVISSEGLGAMRRLYSENKLNSLQFKDYYENYGKSVDPFVIEGYSAKKAKENWMEDVPEFTNMVNKGVQFGLGLAGAGAGGVGNSILANSLGRGTLQLLQGTTPTLLARTAPYFTAPLTVGSRVYPYINPMTSIGLGFGAHSAANFADPKSASRQSLSKAYENPTTENILDATGNVTMDALGVLTSPGMGNMLLQGAKGIVNTPKAIGNLYDDVATGNSLLTDLGVPAWKLEKPLRAPKSSEYIVKNYTDDQIKILDKYGKGMKDLTPEEWQKLEELRKSGVTDFSRGDYPISRIIDYYAPSSAENKAIQALERGDVFTTPTDKSIRTWSAGIPKTGPSFEGKTRLVIPRRYTKNLGNEFAGMPYYDKRSQFIWDSQFGLNTNAVKEKELIGNIPEGFKVIGKSKEGGINNLIIKPITSPNPETTFGGPFMMMGPNTPLGRILFKTKLGPSGNVTHTLIDDANKAISETEKVAKTVDNTFAPIVGSKVPEGVDPRTINFSRSVYEDAERASEWLQYPKSTPEILRSYIEGSRTGEIPAAWERVMQNYANVTGNKQALNDYLLGRTSVRPSRFTAPPEPPPAPPTNIESYPTVAQSNNFINLRRNNPVNQNPVYNTLDNLIIDPVKGTIKNSSSANAVTKLKDKISQITNTVSSKLSSINKNIGNYIDKNITLNKPKSLTMQDIYAEVNKALEAGLGIKKAKNVKIKLEANSAGDTNVLIDIKPYLLENEEKIRQALPELEQMYPGQSFDEIFANGWINTGTLGFRPVHLQEIGSPRTLTQILKGTPPPEAKYLIGYGDYEVPLAGLRKGSEFPYNYPTRIFKDSYNAPSNEIIKDKIFRTLRLSGEYNKAINQTVKKLGQRLYSGGTGHYEDGAQRYIKELLSGRVDIMNPKEAEKFLKLLNDEKTLGEVNKVLLDKTKKLKLKDPNNPLTDDVFNAIQNIIFKYKKFGGHLYPNRYAYGGNLAPNLPTYYNFKGTPIYRDTTALPFASGGMLNNPPDDPPGTPVLPSLKNLNTNEVSALLYNTVAKIIERKKAEGKIKPGENLDLRGVVAQILLESGNAKSGLTAKYNNFGGLRATQGFIDRGGKTVSMVNKATGKKFLWRAYDTPEQGLEAQIDFLLDNSRYRKAGVFNAKNTQEYLAAVSKAGYAGGEPTYARKVNQMAKSLDKRLKKVTPEKLQELNQTYNISPTLQPIGVNNPSVVNQQAIAPQVQTPVTPPVIAPEILAMRENLTVPAKSSIDLLKQPIAQLEEMQNMGPEINPPSFVPDEGYFMSGLPTPEFKSRVVPFMGKGASNYQTSGGLRLPYISGWNQNQFINPIAKRVQQQSGYDPDYYYGTDEEPGEYEKASLENRPINFEGGFASKKMQRDAQQYLQEYDQYNQFLEDSENYGNIMLGRQFKYGSNLYERQGLIPSMYASSLGRYYKNGGNIDYSMYDVFQHGTYANGGMIKRADGSYSQRGLWDNIRANKGSGKKPTAAMLAQERKINNQKANGGYLSSFKASNIQTY